MSYEILSRGMGNPNSNGSVGMGNPQSNGSTGMEGLGEYELSGLGSYFEPGDGSTSRLDRTGGGRRAALFGFGAAASGACPAGTILGTDPVTGQSTCWPAPDASGNCPAGQSPSANSQAGNQLTCFQNCTDPNETLNKTDGNCWCNPGYVRNKTTSACDPVSTPASTVPFYKTTAGMAAIGVGVLVLGYLAYEATQPAPMTANACHANGVTCEDSACGVCCTTCGACPCAC